jgi:hypothetical protein
MLPCCLRPSAKKHSRRWANTFADVDVDVVQTHNTRVCAVAEFSTACEFASGVFERSPDARVISLEGRGRLIIVVRAPAVHLQRWDCAPIDCNDHRATIRMRICTCILFARSVERVLGDYAHKLRVTLCFSSMQPHPLTRKLIGKNVIKNGALYHRVATVICIDQEVPVTIAIPSIEHLTNCHKSCLAIKSTPYCSLPSGLNDPHISPARLREVYSNTSRARITN